MSPERKSMSPDRVVVPEVLFDRYREDLNIFVTRDGLVICRDVFDREVTPATVARAVSHYGEDRLLYNAFTDHPKGEIRKAKASASSHPLIALDVNGVVEPDGSSWDSRNTPPDAQHHLLGCFLPSWYMAEKFNIPVAACAETGQLLPTLTAASGMPHCPDCVDSSAGIRVMNGEAEVTLLPHITEIEEMINNPTELDRPLDAVVLESPLGYDTDAPVTEAQKAKGISAWRRLENPSDPDQAIMLPIYDNELIPYTTEAEREAEAMKIPRAGDEGMPENYLDYDGILYPIAVSMIVLRDSPILWGQPGTGKSALYRHLSYLTSLPFERISVTPSTEVDELAGKFEYHPDTGTEFKYGRLARAWMRPSVICLDEPNSAKPDVWFLLRPLLDSEKQLAIDLNKGEILPRHESSYLGLAANPAWDYRNSGTNPLADADISRLFHAQVGLPPEKVEEEIVVMHCKSFGFTPDGQQLRQLRQIATDLRDASMGGSLMFSWGTRAQLKVAKLLPYMTMEQAYRTAVGASLEPEQENLFTSIVRGRL